MGAARGEPHRLEPTAAGVCCTVCRWTWQRPPAQPCPGAPRYAWGAIPDHLATATQLRQAGLRPGGPVQGVLYSMSRHQWHDLFDRAAATRAPAPAPAQLAALARGRATQAARRQATAAAEVAAERAAWEQAARDRQALQLEMVAWARRFLDSGGWGVLATKTVLLGPPLAWAIVDLAVLDPDGAILFETLIRPGGAIRPQRGAARRFTDDLVAGAPPLAAVLPALQQVLRGRGVVSYHARFDRRALVQAARDAALRLPRFLSWDDAGSQYAAWWNDWDAEARTEHDAPGEYRWQPVPDLPTAVEEGRAVLDRLHEMAAGPPDPQARHQGASGAQALTQEAP